MILRARAFKEMVLVKVKIDSAQYYPFQPKFAYKSNFIGLLNRFYNWLFKEPTRTEPIFYVRCHDWDFDGEGSMVNGQLARGY